MLAHQRNGLKKNFAIPLSSPCPYATTPSLPPPPLTNPPPPKKKIMGKYLLNHRKNSILIHPTVSNNYPKLNGTIISKTKLKPN